jgi:hypothetical protein
MNISSVAYEFLKNIICLSIICPGRCQSSILDDNHPYWSIENLFYRKNQFFFSEFGFFYRKPKRWVFQIIFRGWLSSATHLPKRFSKMDFFGCMKNNTAPKKNFFGIDLRQMIFIHGRWFEKRIFPLHDTIFSSL